VDEAKLAAAVGAPVERGTASFVRGRTGYAIGGVPPFGHRDPIRTLVDEGVMPYPRVWAAAGTPSAVFPTTGEELVRLTGGLVAALRRAVSSALDHRSDRAHTLASEIVWRMTSANLQFVRSLYAAWERGDWSSAEWADPEIEFVGADGPTRGVSKGLPGLAKAWREFLDPWEEWRVEAEEFRELDDGRVLVLINLSGRGKASGLEVGEMRAEAANLFHIRAGKVTRLALYWDRDRAFADAGLATGERTAPEENVGIVLEGIRRFEALDFEGVTHLWHPDSQITGPEGWPEPGPFEGRGAVIGQFRRLAADWGRQRVSGLRVVAATADWVVVTFRWETQGGRSGAATAASFAAAYRVIDGRMSEAHFRWTPEQALEVAGLCA
jgi:ketosteroid isomerase-like protein